MRPNETERAGATAPAEAGVDHEHPVSDELAAATAIAVERTLPPVASAQLQIHGPSLGAYAARLHDLLAERRRRAEPRSTRSPLFSIVCVSSADWECRAIDGHVGRGSTPSDAVLECIDCVEGVCDHTGCAAFRAHLRRRDQDRGGR